MGRTSSTYKILFSTLVILITLTLAGASGVFAQGGPNGNASETAIQAVMAVQDRSAPWLMGVRGIVGVATGLADDGTPVILVLAATPEYGMVPRSIEGVPVVVRITGKIMAMIGPPPGKGPGSGGGGGSGSLKTTDKWPRPVPIGISTGNGLSCSAGTISARVKDIYGQVYALSNNHVYALENTAPIGSTVMQPGLYDTSCFYDAANIFGTLKDYKPMVFSTSASNVIDAAIAVTSVDDLSNATPPDGYGIPKSNTVQAEMNQLVQKYGRTTNLTHGTVIALNGMVDVSYSSGTARFVQQIIVGSNRPFIKAGDSGSLLVTDPGREPVGLLFAGTSSGKTAIANPIDDVLNNFEISIDGE